MNFYWLMQNVKTTLKPQKKLGFDQHKKFTVDSKFDWQLIDSEKNELSLFATKKIIEINFQTNKVGRAGSQFLQHCHQLNIDDIIYLITIPKIDSAQKKSVWFKSLSAHTNCIQVWPLSKEKLPAWIAKQFKHLQMQTDQQVITLLADYTEGNLLATYQEIKKLYLTYGKTTITKTQLLQQIKDHAQYDIFQLADQVLLGDTHGVIRIFQRLTQQKLEPQLIIWALLRDLRQIIALQVGLMNQQSFGQICSKQRIWPKRQPLFKSLLKRHNHTSIRQLLTEVSGIDSALKSK